MNIFWCQPVANWPEINDTDSLLHVCHEMSYHCYQCYVSWAKQCYYSVHYSFEQIENSHFSTLYYEKAG